MVVKVGSVICDDTETDLAQPAHLPPYQHYLMPPFNRFYPPVLLDLGMRIKSLLVI